MVVAENKNVPELRFSRFNGDWKKKKLKELSKIVDCKHRTPPYVHEGIPVVSPGTIKWGEIDLDSPVKKVSEDDYMSLMDHCEPKYGDLVFSRNQSLGVASIVRNYSKFVLGQDTVLIQSDRSSTFYIYYLLQTYNVQSLIQRLSGGSTFSRINLKDIRNLDIRLPGDSEQQKIATFLGSVDAKLNKLRRKRELLETWKRGLMQKIFSQKLGFTQDDGMDFPDWEVQLLGNHFSVIAGLTYSPDNVQSRGLLVLRSSNVQEMKITLEDNVYVNMNVNTENLSRKGDILLCVRNGSKRLIGKSARIPDNIPKATHGAFMSMLRGDNNDFIFQIMQSEMFFREIHKNLGATINSINGSDLKKFKFLLSIAPVEQQKIANSLSSIDKKIQAVTNQITHTETFKKGLLQKMFV